MKQFNLLDNKNKFIKYGNVFANNGELSASAKKKSPLLTRGE